MAPFGRRAAGAGAGDGDGDGDGDVDADAGDDVLTGDDAPGR